MIVEGISFDTILSKNDGALGLMAGSVEAAISAALTSSEVLIDREKLDRENGLMALCFLKARFLIAKERVDEEKARPARAMTFFNCINKQES